MDDNRQHHVKQREVRFCPLHPDPRQAHSANAFLSEVEGVLETRPLADDLLQVRYDIRQVTLEVIDQALEELGFHLDGSLLSKLKKALYYYTEENERSNLGIEQDPAASTRLFVDQYQRRRHGCRDQRPVHWRSYL